jgi:hypothetical protein
MGFTNNVGAIQAQKEAPGGQDRMTTQEAAVVIGGMGLIGAVCWITHSADPLWALLLLVFIL